MLKKLFAGIGIVFGIIVVLSLFGGNDPDLDVRSNKMFGIIPTIEVKNVGKEPISIVDIVVNDRDDCSTLRDFDTPQNLDRDLYTKEELHKFWVLGQIPNVRYANTITESRKPDKSDYHSFKNISLNIGDSHTWTIPCSSLVRANIVTDKGSAIYSFSSQ